MIMANWVLLGVKTALQGLLTLVFIIYFGRPSLEKFYARKTIAVEAAEAQGGVLPPSTTICGRNPRLNNMGWRGEEARSGRGEETVRGWCGEEEGGIEECVTRQTFDRVELITKVDNGFVTKEPMTEEGKFVVYSLIAVVVSRSLARGFY